MPVETGKVSIFPTNKKGMKKRWLSLLMAICLMATMVPAAFAADEENGRQIPDELPIVYEEDAVTPASEALAADIPVLH